MSAGCGGGVPAQVHPIWSGHLCRQRLPVPEIPVRDDQGTVSVGHLWRPPPCRGTFVCTSRLARSPGQVHGSPRTLRAPTPTSSSHSSGSLSSAVCAWPCGTTTVLAVCAARCWTGGVTTPSPAAAAATGLLRHNAIRDVVCSAVAEHTSVFQRLRNLAFSSRRGRLTLVAPRRTMIPGLLPPLRLPLVAALLTSGSPGGSLVSRRPGIFRSRRCSVRHTSPQLLPLWLMCFMMLSSANGPFRTRLLVLLSVGPPSAHSSWRLVVVDGPRPFGASWLGFPSESRASRGHASDAPRDISLRIAQRISCTLHRGKRACNPETFPENLLEVPPILRAVCSPPPAGDPSPLPPLPPLPPSCPPLTLSWLLSPSCGGLFRVVWYVWLVGLSGVGVSVRMPCGLVSVLFDDSFCPPVPASVLVMAPLCVFLAWDSRLVLFGS